MSKMGFNEQSLQTDYIGVQKGWAVVGGKRCYFKSKFELRWAQYLEWLKLAGEIVNWEYEPDKFEFEGIRSGTVFYTPDFRVNKVKEMVDDEGKGYLAQEVIYHECKGHLTQKDVTKFKRMATYHPDVKLELVMQYIPIKPTRKNAEKIRRIDNARKYVERVFDGSKVLKQLSL